MLSSLPLQVAGYTAVACIIDVTGIPAVAGVPLVTDVLTVAGLPAIAGVPGALGVLAVAFVLVVAGIVLLAVLAVTSLPADILAAIF
jgi:hypothetical protein